MVIEVAEQAQPARSRPRRRAVRVTVSDRAWGWIAPLVVTAIGGWLRFRELGRPTWLVFDETYYVKQAASMLAYGYERAIKTGMKGEEADKLWNAGNTAVWGDKPDFVVHPPTGKWMIAIGEHLFGVTNPVGWRFSVAVAGTLSILVLARIARRMFDSTLIGTTAGLLLAVDGQAFVHSRTGLLDSFVMFFALIAFGCIILDRDQARHRLARLVAERPPSRFGPGLGIRPWRIAAGVSLGLCASTKWSGLFFAAAFGVASVLWDVGARRATGMRDWLVTGLVRDGAAGLAQIVPAAALTYLASWTGWFRTSGGYNRTWADTHPATGWQEYVPDALRSLADYHRQMWDFNTTLQAFHAYMSNPWSWLVQTRPTSFDYRDIARGEYGCAQDSCTIAVINLGNPLIWWGATLGLGVLLFRWALSRDWRAGAVLVGFVGGYLPWFLYQERTIYTFYSVAFVPWVVLTVTYCLALVLGPPDADPRRRLIGGSLAGSYVTAAVACFAFFYPVWSDEPIQHSQWQQRQWMSSWWWPAPDPNASTTTTPAASPPSSASPGSSPSASTAGSPAPADSPAPSDLP